MNNSAQLRLFTEIPSPAHDEKTLQSANCTMAHNLFASECGGSSASQPDLGRAKA